ncbi:MAG TPA: 3-deoxy-D-manno-octulosonic acid transferase [Terriglobales bacterium]|nr:3-deoxy-D-manno-octulosonic acid transferase [Terriglobales bacterium]
MILIAGLGDLRATDRLGSGIEGEWVQWPFFMYWLYSAILAAALILTLPYWLVQMSRHGKYRSGLSERLGRTPSCLGVDPSPPTIWVHAVSVGEVMAVSQLVAELQRRLPAYRIVVSTTTDTGQRLARKRLSEQQVFYCPMDFAFAIRPYLRRLRPELVVIAETELWPNLLRLAHAHGARVAVVNARISDRSWPGYRRFRFLLKTVLRPVDLVLAQTEEDARRLAQLGVPAARLRTAGNLKFDVPTPAFPPIVGSLRKAFAESGAGPVLVCGSTVAEEEPLLLRAFENILASYPQAVMLLAPRHPERFNEVSQLLEALGIRFLKRSLWAGEAVGGGVFLVDTIGELAALYSLADIAFVGGSLVPRGGHNIIEPAQYGVAIMVGPHTEDFRDMVRLFHSHEALRVVGPAELPLVFLELITNVKARRALGERAAAILRSQTGATARTADALLALLAPTSPSFTGGGAAALP